MDFFQLAEIEVSYRSKVKASERPIIRTSKDAYEILLSAWDDNRLDMAEDFNVLMLNRRSGVMGIYRHATGGISGVVADPRLVFVSALKSNACSILIAHNHPSGNLEPSRADEELTQKFKQAGHLLDIKLLDHIILTRESYYSFGDNGLI